jgi:hypothetical protein
MVFWVEKACGLVTQTPYCLHLQVPNELQKLKPLLNTRSRVLFYILFKFNATKMCARLQYVALFKDSLSTASVIARPMTNYGVIMSDEQIKMMKRDQCNVHDSCLGLHSSSKIFKPTMFRELSLFPSQITKFCSVVIVRILYSLAPYSSCLKE